MSVSHVLVETAAAQFYVAMGGYSIGAGRTVPTVAAVLGLISVIIGGLALARPAGRAARAIVVLATALISVIIGGLHAASSAGGLGTGNGLAGAIVAIVLGLIGVVLGGLVLARSRRAGALSRGAARRPAE